MNIEIKNLTPELLDDFLNFFDTTPHNTEKKEDRCYCVGWSNISFLGEDFSTAEKRRDAAVRYINNRNLKGYMAYQDGKVIAWVNANTKSECYDCQYGRMYLGSTKDIGDDPDIRIKSVFCFAVAPEMREKGVAAMLLNKVCEDAESDGFDFVEAYPNKDFMNPLYDCMGPLKLYEKAGFTVISDLGMKLIVRKKLK